MHDARQFRARGRYRHAHLLTAMVAFLLLAALTTGWRQQSTLLDGLFLLMTIAAVRAVAGRRWVVPAMIALAALAVASRLLGHVTAGMLPALLHSVSAALFYGFVVAMLLGDVLREEAVDADKLYGAVTAYLFMVALWAGLYQISLALDPGSLTFPAGELAPSVSGDSFQILYFSFVTMTTLGYGDILPRTPAARILTSLEAWSGQVYLAVVVARLVALQISHSAARGRDPQG